MALIAQRFALGFALLIAPARLDAQERKSITVL